MLSSVAPLHLQTKALNDIPYVGLMTPV